MQHALADLLRKIAGGGKPARDEFKILTDEDADDSDILYGANLLRRRHSGAEVGLCAIINARSGACSEDCAFCAQSSHFKGEAPTYPLAPLRKTREAYEAAQRAGASRFGVVTSGAGPDDEAVAEIAAQAREILSAAGIPICVSLGRITSQQMGVLKDAGIARIHCNIETSERFFPQICTTHSWRDKIETIRTAKAAGMEVCSGGLFGLGENWADRLDMAMALREEGVDSVPLNFLMPRKGTPMEGRQALRPFEALRIIALFRYVLPNRDIRVCGGREATLRGLQSWIFYAGANGAMTGDYLTAAGTPAECDRQMIKDLNLVLSEK